MSRTWGIRLMQILAWLMIGFMVVGAIYILVVFRRAAFAPSEWAKEDVLTTPFNFNLLPTERFSKLMFVLRMLGLWGLTSLFVMPIVGMSRSLSKSGPFTMNNVHRLRLIALGCFIYGFGPLVSPLLPAWRYMLGLLYAHINLAPAAMTLVVLALSEIFQEGLRLREDADATI